VNTLTVKLPNVKGSGGRKGYNLLVVGTKGDDEFQGEYLESETAEMLPGDLVLAVKPIGNAHDHKIGAVLYRADGSAENNLRALAVRTDWPQCKPFLVGKCAGLLADRPVPESSDHDLLTQSVDAAGQTLEAVRTLEAALTKAMQDDGLLMHEVQGIVSQVLAKHIQKNVIAKS
jgi:hypothetical protein